MTLTAQVHTKIAVNSAQLSGNDLWRRLGLVLPTASATDAATEMKIAAMCAHVNAVAETLNGRHADDVCKLIEYERECQVLGAMDAAVAALTAFPVADAGGHGISSSALFSSDAERSLLAGADRTRDLVKQHARKLMKLRTTVGHLNGADRFKFSVQQALLMCVQINKAVVAIKALTTYSDSIRQGVFITWVPLENGASGVHCSAETNMEERARKKRVKSLRDKTRKLITQSNRLVCAGIVLAGD